MIASDILSVLPPLPLKLSRDDVHLWQLELGQMNLDIPWFASMLSTEERMRAENFRFERHKNRFIVTRGTLRKILSLYLKTEPNRLKFCYGAYGKLHLPENVCNVQFNLAHSHELALYALTHGRNVGVDVEYVRYIPDFEKVGASFLSKREKAAYKTLPSNQKLRAFFDFWTSKEAYSKAIGTGLTLPFDQFDVPVNSRDSSCKINFWKDAKKVSRWSFVSLVPAPGYIATLVTEGHDWHLHRFRF
jgi:4'-phosphopantetheinyl transferase